MKSKITGYSERSPSRRPPRRAGRGFLAMVFAAAPAFLAMGCDNPAADLCDFFCECEGCTQTEYDECLGNGEGAMDEADEAGCSSEYHDFVSCVVEEAECRDDEHFEYDGCVVEKEAADQCGDIGLNPCQEAAEKLCTCQINCGGGPSGEQCTGVAECQAKCMNAASCNDIIIQPPGSVYDNCVSSC